MPRLVSRPLLTLAAGLSLLWATVAPLPAAEPLAQPQGDVILTVTGDLAVTNDGQAAHFDRAMLDSLPQTTVHSFTDWTEGKQRFAGVLLRDLMERLGADGTTIIAYALNDFRAEIPWADLERHDVLLALTRDGTSMRVRDKGPIWIIYPNDQPPVATPFEHNSKMVWQLARLDVK